MSSLVRKTSALVGFAFIAPLLLAACGPGSSSSGSQGPKQEPLRTLTLDYYSGAKGELASTLDPAQVTSADDADTIALSNANLVHILPNNTVAPDLATWTVSKDRTVYIFTIRKDARFSNGHPVTAADAAYSIKRALAPETRSPVAVTYMGLIKGADEYHTGKAKNLAGVKVLRDRKLQITISHPAAYFLLTLAYPAADVLDRQVMKGKESSAANNYLTTTCRGNQGAGPFTFVCNNDGSDRTSFYKAGRTPQYSLVPNEYYYGPKPTIKLSLPAVNTVDTNYKQYLAGDADMTAVPTSYIGRWKDSKEFHAYPTSIVTYLSPNTQKAPFDNQHCRLALAYGIGRETIAHDILHDSTYPEYVIVPRGYLGYYNGKATEPHFNLKRAKAELQQCSSRNTTVELVYPTGTSDADRLFAAIGHMMQQVGFKVKIKAVTANDWLNVVTRPLNATNTQLVRNGWQQDYPDPHDYLSVLLRSDAQYNIGQWKNPAYDRLVDRAAQEPNREKRAELYRQAQHLALSEGAWIALTSTIGHSLIKPYVHGLVGTPAYGNLVPVNYDWSKVHVDAH